MQREPAFYEFAPSLLDNWSLFADHRVTRFALRRLNTAGRAYGRQLGLLPQRSGLHEQPPAPPGIRPR
jgi:hypothetical protein